MKKLNQKGFTGFEIILLVLVVAALGFAGFVVYQRGKDDKNAPQTVVTQKDDNTKAKEEEKDPTADWQTYTSTTGKFTIKYPKSWVAAANPEMCAEGLLLLGGNTASVGKCAADGARAFGQMAITWRTDRADLSLCGLSSSWRTDSKDTTTVAGVPAVKTTGTYIANDEAEGGQAKGNTSVQYCFVKNNTQYIASYTKWSEYPDVLNDFNTMVTKTFTLN
jgi:hypothetical protein